MSARISDLLDIIHMTIIKQSPNKENEVILAELKAIDEKIKNKVLPDYEVKDTPFYRSIVANDYKLIFGSVEEKT